MRLQRVRPSRGRTEFGEAICRAVDVDAASQLCSSHQLVLYLALHAPDVAGHALALHS